MLDANYSSFHLDLEPQRRLEVSTESTARRSTDQANLSLRNCEVELRESSRSARVSVISPRSFEDCAGVMLLTHGGGYVSGTRFTGWSSRLKSRLNLD